MYLVDPNLELICFILLYALIIVLVWAYHIKAENKQISADRDKWRQSCQDMSLFAHTMHQKVSK